MARQWMTYADAAKHMGIKPASVKAKAIRLKLNRRINNAGLAEVEIDLDDIQSRPKRSPSHNPTTSPDDNQVITPSPDMTKYALRSELDEVRSELRTVRDENSDLKRELIEQAQQHSKSLTEAHEIAASERRELIDQLHEARKPRKWFGLFG